MGVLAVGVVGVAVLGLAGASVVCAAVLLSAAAGRAFPDRRGPWTWAAGVLATVAVLIAGSALSGLGHSEMSRPVAIAILAAPNVLGAALWAWFARRRSALPPPAAAPAVPLLCLLAVLVVAWAVGLTGPGHDVAWAMSGDARNHVTITRGIDAAGGLRWETLTSFPALANALLGLLVVAGRDAATRTGLYAGEPHARAVTFAAETHALASVYVLAAAALAVLLAGAVLAGVRRPSSRAGTVAVAAVALVAAATAASPVVLGTGLAGGFLSAYAALPPALAGVVAALDQTTRHRAPATTIWIQVVAVLLAFLAWYPVVVVPLAALAVVVARTVTDLARDRAVPTAATWIALGLATAEAMVLVGVVLYFRVQLATQFALTGSVRPVPPALLAGLGCLAVAWLAAGPRGERWRSGVGVAIAGAGTGAVVVLASLAQQGFGWTYYSQKTLWLVVCSLVWLPFAALARLVAASENAGRGRALPVASVAAAVGLAVLLGGTTTSLEPLRSATRGWAAPSAPVVREVAARAGTSDAFILWDWSTPEDDRAGNFWAALVWGVRPYGALEEIPGHGGGVLEWAYFYTPGSLDDLCDLAAAVPGLDVVTRGGDLADRVAAQCPDVDVEIHVTAG